MTLRNPEILAPAGGMDSVLAAVRAGADAVYLAQESFGARRQAKNFSKDELKEATAYCRLHGVKVYQTVNTVVFDRELSELTKTIKTAVECGVDALIVQDFGVASVAREIAPDLPLHASTQMNIHTPAGARFVQQQGFRRAVLARELTLQEIAEIHAAAPTLELEVFVHGALCMCMSGQCYFSAMLGSRSGNRGYCAQPCRLPYSTGGVQGHPLSLKDLSAYPCIEELREAGVSSFKFEGRMKRSEYVTAAVTACRKALQGEPYDADTLQNVFSRSGFTHGYLTGERNRSMFGIRTEDDLASSKTLKSLAAAAQKERAHLPVSLDFSVAQNVSATLTLTDGDGNSVTVSGDAGECAEHRPLDTETAKAALAKLGGTPFYAEEIRCNIGNNTAYSRAALNALRRSGVEALSQKRTEFSKLPTNPVEAVEISPHKAKSPQIWLRGVSAHQLSECDFSQIAGVILPYRELTSGNPFPVPAYAELPRANFGQENEMSEALSKLKSAGITDVVVHHLGQMLPAKEAGFHLHGGFSLNITNTRSIRQMEKFGLSDVTLSFELTLPQIAGLGGNLPRGMLVYGHLPLMITRICPVKTTIGCRRCNHTGGLTDRRGKRLRVSCENGYTQIFNPDCLYMGDRLEHIDGVDFFQLYFSGETPTQVAEALERVLTAAPMKAGGTRGLYDRGVI